MSEPDIDEAADEPVGLSLRQILATEEDEGESDEPDDGAGPERRWHQADISFADLEAEIPDQIRPYLKVNETRVMATRQHPVKLIVPAVAFVGGFAVAAVINGVLYAAHQASDTPVHALWISYVVVALWAATRYAAWRQRWFVVTGQRLMLISGVVARHVDMLPMTKLRDVHYEQTMVGRVIGYATFNCDSIATEHALQEVYFVPYPEEIYREICELIMPEGGKRGPANKAGERRPRRT
jgi:membrane protein YdbS with pleckstrin-like domain